jgi:predicted amidohydrolase
MKKYVVQAAERGANIILFAEGVLNSCDRVKNPSCTLQSMVEPLDGPCGQAIAELTKKYGVYVVYGFLEKYDADPAKCYNSAAIMGPKGIIGSYHKMHVFVESQIKGREPLAFDTPWGPVGIGICYDNYFCPELARMYTLKGSRLLLNPTGAFAGPGLPDQMLRALPCRVAENFMFVASCNKVGPREYYNYVGHSMIIGPWGSQGNIPSWEIKTFAGPASSTEEELIVATVDLGRCDELRKSIAFFEDNPRQGEPEFLPQIWAEQYGALAEPQIDQEKEALKSDNIKAKQTAYIAFGAAALLLVTSVMFAVLAFGRRKK